MKDFGPSSSNLSFHFDGGFFSLFVFFSHVLFFCWFIGLCGFQQTGQNLPKNARTKSLQNLTDLQRAKKRGLNGDDYESIMICRVVLNLFRVGFP